MVVCKVRFLQWEHLVQIRKAQWSVVQYGSVERSLVQTCTAKTNSYHGASIGSIPMVGAKS